MTSKSKLPIVNKIFIKLAEIFNKIKLNTSKKIAAIFAAIIVLVAIILLSINSAYSAPLNASDRFVTYIKNNKSASAYSMLSDDAKLNTNLDDFTKKIEDIGPILTGEPKVKSKQINTTTDKVTTARIVYDIKDNDNYTHVLTISLIDNGSGWKVQNFESVKK